MGVNRKIAYGGYVIWEMICPDYSFYEVEKPGWDYSVATLNTLDDAKGWIDDHPDGDAVVEDIKAENDARMRDMIIDILCG